MGLKPVNLPEKNNLPSLTMLVCMLLPGVVRDFFFSYSLPLLN